MRWMGDLGLGPTVVGIPSTREQRLDANNGDVRPSVEGAPLRRTLVGVLALALAYYAAGRLGFLVAIKPGNVSPFWAQPESRRHPFSSGGTTYGLGWPSEAFW